MNDLSNICVPCGLCCDGTLIGFVELSSEELPIMRELMDIEEADGKGFIIHPCNSLSDGCNIYSNRPKQCDIFKCKLLKSFERKELDFYSAIEIVDLIKQQKIDIEKKIAILQIELQSSSFYFKIVELKKILHKKTAGNTINKNYLELLSDIKQLDIILLKEFGITLD